MHKSFLFGPLLILFCFSSSCEKEETDPFALPEVAYDCRGLWEPNPEGPVGHFSYIYNGEEYLGITNGGVLDNGLYIALLRVYREDCFSTNGISFSGLDLDLRDTVRNFTCFQTHCEVNEDCRSNSRRSAIFEFLDHDNPNASYSTNPDKETFIM